jgi:hypothetical protein
MSDNGLMVVELAALDDDQFDLVVISDVCAYPQKTMPTARPGMRPGQMERITREMSGEDENGPYLIYPQLIPRTAMVARCEALRAPETVERWLKSLEWWQRHIRQDIEDTTAEWTDNQPDPGDPDYGDYMLFLDWVRDAHKLQFSLRAALEEAGSAVHAAQTARSSSRAKRKEAARTAALEELARLHPDEFARLLRVQLAQANGHAPAMSA